MDRWIYAKYDIHVLAKNHDAVELKTFFLCFKVSWEFFATNVLILFISKMKIKLENRWMDGISYMSCRYFEKTFGNSRLVYTKLSEFLFFYSPEICIKNKPTTETK